jgi:hypothetical protein
MLANASIAASFAKNLFDMIRVPSSRGTPTGAFCVDERQDWPVNLGGKTADSNDNGRHHARVGLVPA